MDSDSDESVSSGSEGNASEAESESKENVNKNKTTPGKRRRKGEDGETVVSLCFKIKDCLPGNWYSHYKDKKIIRPSYRYDWNTCTGKTIFLYWDVEIICEEQSTGAYPV